VVNEEKREGGRRRAFEGFEQSGAVHVLRREGGRELLL